MALFYECMLKCARKLLDTADIVRDAIYHQFEMIAYLLADRITSVSPTILP